MKRKIKKFLRAFFGGRQGGEIYPDEVLLEARNIPGFDINQFEGRIIKPISWKSVLAFGVVFLLIFIFYIARIWHLQIGQGDKYFEISQNNHLRYTPIFSQRGVIYDRNGHELAWNEKSEEEFSRRQYTDLEGVSHVLGFVKYPSKDKYGFYFRNDYEGKDGVEKYLDESLKGQSGIKILEVNALNSVVSQNSLKEPERGKDVNLSIDADLSNAIYTSMKDVAEEYGFKGGAAIMMDIWTGEVISLVSYPEFKSAVMTEGSDVKQIGDYSTNPARPFLNRVIQGVYTPGSIIKPFMSMAALNEKIIDPSEKILSTGSISIKNDYFPDLFSVFKDWKAHGWVDMRKAIAVSSNVYFYEIGGGYNGRKGLGITKIGEYFRMFDFGSPVNVSFFEGASGTIPSPEWKAENFDGESWRLGDTYHTSIGQYGFQVSPLQVVRAIGAIASNGTIVKPSIIKQEEWMNDYSPVEKELDFPDSYFKIVTEGMRLSTLEGTSQSINLPFVEVASKSGTAELGTTKKRVNSWITGYFPYQNPKYAFAMVMEEGPVENLVGAGSTMNKVFHWINENSSKYFKPE